MKSEPERGAQPTNVVRLAAFRRRGIAIEQLVGAARIVPVARLPGAEYGAPLAKTLLEGGLPVLELSWDPSTTVDIVRAIRRVVPDMAIGVGVVYVPDDVEALSDAGVSYIVGSNARCGEAARRCGLPFIAAVTDDEQVHGFAREGHRHCRILPTAGEATVRSGAVRRAHPGVRFQGYSSEPGSRPPDTAEVTPLATVCSWIAPRHLTESGRWDLIRANIEHACALLDGERAVR